MSYPVMADRCSSVGCSGTVWCEVQRAAYLTGAGLKTIRLAFCRTHYLVYRAVSYQPDSNE